MVYCQGRPVRIDAVLNSTMDFLSGMHSGESPMEVLNQLVDSRLNRFKHEYDGLLKQQENTRQASSDYILMGALMHRYDHQIPTWQLYLRDYISSDNGKLWRVLSEVDSDRRETKV